VTGRCLAGGALPTAAEVDRAMSLSAPTPRKRLHQIGDAAAMDGWDMPSLPHGRPLRPDSALTWSERCRRTICPTLLCVDTGAGECGTSQYPNSLSNNGINRLSTFRRSKLRALHAWRSRCGGREGFAVAVGPGPRRTVSAATGFSRKCTNEASSAQATAPTEDKFAR